MKVENSRIRMKSYENKEKKHKSMKLDTINTIIR